MSKRINDVKFYESRYQLLVELEGSLNSESLKRINHVDMLNFIRDFTHRLHTTDISQFDMETMKVIYESFRVEDRVCGLYVKELESRGKHI